jgi:hypothetical protein
MLCVYVSQNAIAMLIEKDQNAQEMERGNLLPEHIQEARTL